MPIVLETLNQALHRALRANEKVVLLGEDIRDPYGGAFKVTHGLSSAFPKQVFTTPISEAGMTGLATGMALGGLRPVVEIMFGDFLTLIADQVINHMAKFRWMYNDQVYVPLVIRTPMGGRRGYGPTHSQTLEKLFLGVPGLHLLAPAALGDPGGLLERTILETQDPVIFIENKLLYLLPVLTSESLSDFEMHSNEQAYGPCYQLTIRGAPSATLTLVAYGYMAELARQAVLRLAYENEIFAELIIPTQLAPFECAPIFDSVHRTQKLLTVEEGTLSLGWGAEVIARCAVALGREMQIANRLAAQETPIPASGPLETATLPGVDQILQAAIEISG